MKRFLCVLLILCLLLPSALAAGANTYYINGLTADRVHLRAQPNANAQSQGLYFTGTEVERISTSGSGWLYVKIGSETGYIQQDYLTQTQPLSQAPLYVVNNTSSTWVNLRAGASTNTTSLGRIDNGASVWVLGETKSGWSYVETLTQRGYMMTSFLKLVEEAKESPKTCIVGKTGEGDYIHQLTADNSQTLYFTSPDAAPALSKADVNFDGQQDLIVRVSQGASNSYYEFFVYTGGRYVYAEHTGMVYGLSNYQLFPTQRMVLSQATNGHAGALHEWHLFRWNGTNLQLVRSAVSVQREEYTTISGMSALMTYPDQNKITVTAYDTAASAGRVLWQRTVTSSEMTTGTVLSQEESWLWQGLR